MLRTIFAVLFLVIYLVLSLPIMLVMLIVRGINPEKGELAMLRVIQWAFRVVLFISGVKLTTIGYDRIPKDEAVLFIGNHQSYFDIVIAYSQMPGRTGFIGKKVLKKVPLLNLNMMFIKCLFLDRDDIRQGLETIKTAIEYVKEGRSIFIFPEGTRNKSSELPLMEFHRGSFKIAQRTGCKIVPVSINNSAEILEKHFPFIKSTHVVIEYGEPVPYKSLTRDEQKQIDVHFRSVLTDMISKNQAQV